MHPILQFSARRTNWARYPEASSTGDRSYCKLIRGRSVVRSFRLPAVVAASWVHLTPVPYMDPAPSAKSFAGVRVKPVAAIYSASLRSFILRSEP